ncbi:hypothetical protein PG994_000299 [Apiospora phragmitis]|uniref:ATP synthase subunit K, mitochondrial n=1 Tax=Apiospora phragmitis TaxID=2905665 RepID=A0ABR1X608_9PEZI
MVQMYSIAGQKIGSHYLAMGVLSALFGGTYLAVSGPSPAKKAAQTPPINASSPDEEDFIKCAFDPLSSPPNTIANISGVRKFLDSADKDEKAKH